MRSALFISLVGQLFGFLLKHPDSDRSGLLDAERQYDEAIDSSWVFFKKKFLLTDHRRVLSFGPHHNSIVHG